MSTDRWLRLNDIFSEARSLPNDERVAFVTRASGGDHALAAEAMALLAADDASGEFMAAPALDRLARAWASEGWSLKPGDCLGVYTIVQLLGMGGAGEVWRARDQRLNRDVAIKVLLPQFSTDVNRVQRFADEARAAGALNHSNILTVHDVGEHHGMPFLVAEYLEGQTLRQRLEATQVPVDDVVAVGLGLARGLSAAHARGLIHRDLKPENVFLRLDGGVKILDFGLAKLHQPFDRLPADATEILTGTIAGTAGYMAPEQVKGEPTDARTDLFAVGVILCEMLAGRHPFRRASTFETLHAVLSFEPPDLLTISQSVPAPLAAIVMRLLKKSPDARFHSAADLAWSLEQTAKQVAATPVPEVPAGGDDVTRKRSWNWFPMAALVAGMMFVGWWLWQQRDRQPQVAPLLQFTWTLPDGIALDSPPVISPDGEHIAFVGRNAATSRLFVRSLRSPDATVVPGTDGARQPFWSPDSRSLGFFVGSRLMKVTWPGGAPIAVAQAREPRGGTWSSSGTILFGPDVILSGVDSVPADGGESQRATVLNVALGDTSHWWPAFLPDGIHFLYFLLSADLERRGVYLARIDRLDSDPGGRLLRSDSQAVYVPLPDTNDGALLYLDDDRLTVRRFDPARLTVDADARTAGLRAGRSTLWHPPMMSASADVLAFASSSVPGGNRLECVTRNGERLRVWEEPEAQNWPRASPDGRLLARQRVDGSRNTPDIWVDDLDRNTRVRVTKAVEPDIHPVWSPDNRRLAYVSGNLPRRPGQRTLSIAAADGTGVLQSFKCPSSYCEPTDWSPDGRYLVLNVLDSRGWDVWTLPTDGSESRPLLADSISERDARVSPNGRWVVYVSEESGRPEVSVRTISGPPQRIVLSDEGGSQPVWRRDGGELFFVDPRGNLRAVRVSWLPDGSPTFGLPAPLKVPPIGTGHWGTQYDVSPDGSRIYLLRRNDDPAPREIHVVTGWRRLLENTTR